MRTHIPDSDGLKHYLGVYHMGDHVVLIVKAWYKLTWGSIHRHLVVILRYLFQGVRDLYIYICRLWNTISCLFTCCIVVRTKDHRSLWLGDWYAYLRLMATLCIWFDRYICVLLTKNKLKCLHINIFIFVIWITDHVVVIRAELAVALWVCTVSPR